MDDLDFDISGAVDTLGDELGFPAEKKPEEDIQLKVDPPATPAAAEKESATTSPAPTDPAAPIDPAAPAAVTAPRTWRAEAAAEFSKLSPVVQQEILKREEDIFKGIEGYKADAAFGNTLKGVLQPYLPVLEQYGIKPETQVKSMMEANYVLAFGSPQEKAQLVRQVIQDYQIDPAELGFTTPTGSENTEVAALQKQLQVLQSQITGAQQQRDNERKAEITRHVQTFASDPKNLYFEELSNDIAHLLRTGAEKTVEAAYEKAIWMNPAVRAKELARQQAERDEIERKAAAEKAAAAKKATAVNVRPKAKSGSATAPLGSMDDTLTEALANIRGRA